MGASYFEHILQECIHHVSVVKTYDLRILVDYVCIILSFYLLKSICNIQNHSKLSSPSLHLEMMILSI